MVLPKLIHPGYVLGGLQECYVTELLGGGVLHWGQIIDSPPHWYPLHAITGRVISEEMSLKQQSSCHPHNFATGLCDAEPQRGQSITKVYGTANDIAKVSAPVGRTH